MCIDSEHHYVKPWINYNPSWIPSRLKTILESSYEPEFLQKKVDSIFSRLLEKIKGYIDIFEKGWGDLKKLQERIFDNVCEFIFHFEIYLNLAKIHNNIGKTSLEEFKKKTLWQKLFHLTYGKHWENSKSCEWGSCTEWTLMLYDFFSKLKEAWLKIDIKIFRYKKYYGKLAKNIATANHSWLVIVFYWKKYLIDYWWFELPLIKPVQSFIDVSRETPGWNELADAFEKNFNQKELVETPDVEFFDDINDYIRHVKNFSVPIKKVSLYVKEDNEEIPLRYIYEFTKTWLSITIEKRKSEDWNWKRIYTLKNNKVLFRDKFLSGYIKNIWIIEDEDGIRYISQPEREELKRCIKHIKNKVNTDKLYEYYELYNGKKIFWKSMIVGNNEGSFIKLVEL